VVLAGRTALPIDCRPEAVDDAHSPTRWATRRNTPVHLKVASRAAPVRTSPSRTSSQSS
jgi:hypothetical protein